MSKITQFFNSKKQKTFPASEGPRPLEGAYACK